jgi:hypothetical protein
VRKDASHLPKPNLAKAKSKPQSDTGITFYSGTGAFV